MSEMVAANSGIGGTDVDVDDDDVMVELEVVDALGAAGAASSSNTASSSETASADDERSSATAEDAQPDASVPKTAKSSHATLMWLSRLTDCSFGCRKGCCDLALGEQVDDGFVQLFDHTGQRQDVQHALPILKKINDLLTTADQDRL